MIFVTFHAAKVLLFIYMCKFFDDKMIIFCIFAIK